MHLLNTLSARLGLVAWAALLSVLVLMSTLHYLKQAPKTPDAPPLDPQHITAPLVVVPYVEHFVSVETVTTKEGESKVVSKDIYTDHTAVLLPSELTIRTTFNIDHTALVVLKGKIDYQPLLENNPDNERNVRWDKAQLLVGIKHLLALTDQVKVFWNDDHMNLQADTQALPNLGKGFHMRLPESKEQKRYQTFEIQLPLSLGSNLTFTPTGQQTQLEMTVPSTTNLQALGALKPIIKVASTGTSALWTWQVPNLIRGYPNFWVQDQVKSFDLHQAPIGVELKAKTNVLEQQWGRLMQWSFALLGLVLLVALVLELLSGRYLHWVHYTVLGLSVSLMYLLLRSLDALIPFNQALQWSLVLLAAFASISLGLVLGMRALLIAGCLYAGVIGSMYYLTLQPAYGILGLVICAALLGLLLIIGSVRFLNPHIELDTDESSDELG